MLLFAKIFLFLLPFQFVVTMGSEDIPLLRVLALGLMFVFLGKLFVEEKILLPPLLFCGLFLSWFFSVLLSLFFGGEWELGFRKLLFLINLLPLVFIWYALSIGRKERQYLLGWLITGGVVGAVIGLTFFMAQWFFGVSKVFHFLLEKILPFFLGERFSGLVAAYPSLLVNIGGETWLRVTTFFPDPHVAAFFFGITACLAMGLFFETRERRWILAATVLLLATLFTFSRGGYLGLFGALLVGLFFWPSKTWKVKPLLFLMAGLPLLLWLGMPIVERFISTFTLADASSTERLSLWQTASATWQSHPFLGVGLGNYAEWVHPGVGATLPYYAHNLYLDIAVETGLLGLSFFLGLVGLALQAVWKRARFDGVALGTLAALVFYLTYSLFETALFSVPITILLTLLLALSLERGRSSPVE